jgi:SAM-dependent methyltransferase
MALLAFDSTDWLPVPSRDGDSSDEPAFGGWQMPRVALPCADDLADRTTWERISLRLSDLHQRGRHALRIVEVGCGRGEWLMRTVARARELGFTAIEARGIDSAPDLIADARASAARFMDATVGIGFEVADAATGLASEADNPADLVLCLDGALNRMPRAVNADVARSLAAAGTDLIVRVRASDSDPAALAPALTGGCSVRQDDTQDRLEIDLSDGTHISIPSHPFTEDEFIALFAPHGRLVDGGITHHAGGQMVIELRMGDDR